MQTAFRAKNPLVACAMAIVFLLSAFAPWTANAAEQAESTDTAVVGVEASNGMSAGETYLILSPDKEHALSSDAGNQWGSANAAIPVTVSEDGTQIASETDLSTCLWTCDEDGHLCNQKAVWLNYMDGGPFLKPSGSAETKWIYDKESSLLSSGDYTVWYDLNNKYFNGVMTEKTGADYYKTYLFRVTGESGGGAHQHKYTAAVTDPTCKEGGYTTYTCSCGDSYISDDTDALGHDWGDWTYDSSSPEYEHYRSCQRVNGGYKCDAFEKEPCEHVLKKTVAPTCGARGYSLYRCDVCGHEIHTDYVNATGKHQYEAVSREDGSGYHELKCTVCGQSTLEACSWDKGVITVPATEDQDGLITYTCTVCSDTRQERVPAGDGFSQDDQGNYLIQSIADLERLAELVNEGNQTYSSASYLLTGDLTLSGEWTPIGAGRQFSGNAFSGTFDGGQHTISGLSITSLENGNCYGLFGVVRDAKICNLAVEGSIRNVTENVVGSGCHIGGIVGAADGSLTLENVAGHVRIINSFSYSTGSLYTNAVTSHVGGLVGYAYSTDTGTSLTIRSCYADADVTNENVNSTYAGYSRAYVGGLVGGAYHYYADISISDSFANMDKITVSNTILAKDQNGAVYVYGDVILGYNYGGIEPGENLYFAPELASSVANSSMLYTVANRTMSAQAKTITAALVGTNRFKTAASGKVIFQWETDTSDDPGEGITPDTSWYRDDLNKLRLQDEADLLGLAKLVSQGYTFDEKTVLLEKDITLSDNSAFSGIGNEQHPFAGVFDGQGNRILNLSIERDTTDSYVGLFGYLEKAEVKNLTVAGSIYGGDYTGGIAGFAVSSAISNCGNEAAVTGSGHVGGIAGAIGSNANGEKAEISFSTNKGRITNLSDVSRYLYTGGLTGDMDPFSIVQSSYNAGQITGGSETGAFTGGIAGMCTSGTIDSCYNSGILEGAAGSTGAIAGAGNTSSCSNNFYLEGTSGSETGSVQSAAQLKGGGVVDSLNRSTEGFQINCGSYPVLLWENAAVHAWGAWKPLDEDKHQRICAREHSHTETADHEWDKGIEKKTATYTEAGEKVYTCTVCGREKTEVIPVLNGSYIRLFGDTRYDTGMAIIDEILKTSETEKFDAVIVTTGANYADALSGSYLAKRKNAPILIVDPKSTNQIKVVTDYIREYMDADGTVYILGGSAAVPYDVEQNLSGYQTQRLGGATRYDTNLAILRAAGVRSDRILICTGDNFADSLSASAAGEPIMLAGSKLTSEQEDWLKNLPKKSYMIIGGENAVNRTVENQIRSVSMDVARISGADRYETSVMVAETFFDSPTEAVLAVGTNYPDGLCGGPLALTEGCPLLLASETSYEKAEEYCKEKGIRHGYVLGGAGLISDQTAGRIFQIR